MASLNSEVIITADPKLIDTLERLIDKINTLIEIGEGNLPVPVTTSRSPPVNANQNVTRPKKSGGC